MKKNNVNIVQLDFSSEDNWSNEDVEKCQAIFDWKITKKDLCEAVENHVITRIADAFDYDYAYEEWFDFENGFSEDTREKISKDKFIEEINKGYGKSEYVQIGRLICLSNGIWYDEEYAC